MFSVWMLILHPGSKKLKINWQGNWTWLFKSRIRTNGTGRGPKELATKNTHRGLYRYSRQLYGVSYALGILQRTMESLLSSFRKQWKVYHAQFHTLASFWTIFWFLEWRIKGIFRTWEKWQLKVSLGSWITGVSVVIYKLTLECMGYHINETGIHLLNAKVNAVKIHLHLPMLLSSSVIGIAQFLSQIPIKSDNWATVSVRSYESEVEVEQRTHWCIWIT